MCSSNSDTHRTSDGRGTELSSSSVTEPGCYCSASFVTSMPALQRWVDSLGTSLCLDTRRQRGMAVITVMSMKHRPWLHAARPVRMVWRSCTIQRAKASARTNSLSIAGRKSAHAARRRPSSSLHSRAVSMLLGSIHRRAAGTITLLSRPSYWPEWAG
jgi:hypothetical protein